MRVGPTGPSPSGSTRVTRDASGSRIAFRSAPAQNVPLAPVSTATDSVVVGVEAPEGVGERVGGRAVDGVGHLRPVDGDDGDRAVDFVVDRHAAT